MELFVNTNKINKQFWLNDLKDCFDLQNNKHGNRLYVVIHKLYIQNTCKDL